jgi:hypothetical protein
MRCPNVPDVGIVKKGISSRRSLVIVKADDVHNLKAGAHTLKSPPPPKRFV